MGAPDSFDEVPWAPPILLTPDTFDEEPGASLILLMEYRGRPPNTLGNFCCPPKKLRLLDKEFNVDSDFSIKHDLIL